MILVLQFRLSVCGKYEKELTEEVDLLDTMLSSLVELREEKGVLTQEEWGTRIKKNVKV